MANPAYPRWRDWRKCVGGNGENYIDANTASILGTSEKYISMLERGQRELKPIRRAYEAWVEAGLPLDWDRQAFEAERKFDSKKHLAK